jgi:hypothetical protein
MSKRNSQKKCSDIVIRRDGTVWSNKFGRCIGRVGKNPITWDAHDGTNPRIHHHAIALP